MPRELPGLYWDEARGRYFPLSARPAMGSQSRAQSADTVRGSSSSRASTVGVPSQQRSGLAPAPRKRRRVEDVVISPTQTALRTTVKFSDVSRKMHDIMTSNIVSLSEGKVVAYGDHTFSSFHVMEEHNGSFTVSTGDTGGWLQTYKIGGQSAMPNVSRELFLGSSVTSVCRSPTHRLAVSFGPSCRIAVENVVDDAEMWTIMTMPDRWYDVRATHVLGTSLAIGSAKRGILIPDIDAGWNYDVLPTSSDVFSVTQRDCLVYLGTRSGSVKAFDRRLGSHQKPQELFGGRFLRDSRTITHLEVLNEWQMLVSTISGDLELHDLRFGRSTTPLMCLSGHVNTYIADLGIALTPDNNYLFAAGQDQRIRAWSLRTGELLTPSAPRHTDRSYDDDRSELFHQHFADSVVALQVTEGGGGMDLWAVAGKKMYRFGLGRRLE